MSYRYKSRAQVFCDGSRHKYELTIDGHLMVRGEDGRWRSEFDDSNKPDDEQLKLFFIEEEE